MSYAKGAEPMDWAVPVLYARDTSLVFSRPAGQSRSEIFLTPARGCDTT